jgi:hypothetical protein
VAEAPAAPLGERATTDALLRGLGLLRVAAFACLLLSLLALVA